MNHTDLKNKHAALMKLKSRLLTHLIRTIIENRNVDHLNNVTVSLRFIRNEISLLEHALRNLN